MHIIHKSVWVPKILQENLSDNISKIVLEPLPKWYWVTLWNSLRRVLLSSIPWSKVTGIKIDGISHEYESIMWVKDTVLDIMLNLKNLVIKKSTVDTEWIRLSRNKAWLVTASDILTTPGVEILNKDLYITEIDQDWIELNIDIRIQKSVGYLSINDLKEIEDDIDILLIDANFSPVVNVKYEISDTRFGDIINLDKLELIIATNWAISPSNALKFSSNMLASYFGIFNEEKLQVEWGFISDVSDLIEKEKNEMKQELEKEPYTPIEVMGLSPRTLNALINWNILSVEQLTKSTDTKLSSIKWFGKKAMTEIKWWLEERGLKLLWDD